MLEINNLTKKFGSFTAVDNISLQVKAGEFFGFLGPNGAGKTTTIKMIVGLFSPTSGNIFVDGMDTKIQPEETKTVIGYIPDQPFLYDKLTGLEFLFFSGGLFKIPKQKLKSEIDGLIQILELNSWIYKRTEEYSQGMKQRITIAAALLSDPKLILIDEPMIGLDPKSAFLVKNILKEKASAGVSIFMSTHSLNVAEEVCSRLAIIKEGRIIFEDDMQALNNFKLKENKNLESFFLELTK